MTVGDQPRTTLLHCHCPRIPVRPVTTTISASVLRLWLTISVPRLLVVQVIPVRLSLGAGVGVVSVGFVRRSGSPCGLRVFHLLSVRFLLIGMVYIVMVCYISVVGIAGDGGGR